jgi:hypothetical protein
MIKSLIGLQDMENEKIIMYNRHTNAGIKNKTMN